jgi:predicted nucleic acid-binding protein
MILHKADGILLATAHTHGVTLWTQNADFEAMPGVRYRPEA